VFFRALGKEGFAECQIKNTQQSLYTCRVSSKKHSSLPSVKKKHSAKAFLPSAKLKHSAKQFSKPCFGALNDFK
jgi:hypothetical protein